MVFFFLPFIDIVISDCKVAQKLGNALSKRVPAGSPSRGGDVAVYVFDTDQPSLPTPFYSVLVSISIFMALSTIFHSMNSLGNSPLSHPILPALFLPYRSFNYIVLYERTLQPRL